MKTMTLTLVCVLGVLGVGLAAASEQSGQRGGGERLFRADTNNDGRVTKEELRAAREAAFTRLDTDQDGFLTQADRGDRPQREGRGERGNRMGQLDKNADGKVSREEFLSRGYAMFDRLDTNKDGAIDRSEAAAAHGRRGAPKTGG